ncbi:N-acetyl-gamma-glutamyl-phosphate reductase [Streptomyces acidiscabies]|uniref:N-acetyl-gamma-glutamyl-phosphate reductase n=1 Tax=Streptomyces acidiscabies TaxID=42234 RepID=UPI0038F806E8
MSASRVRAAVIGASGFTGGEMLRLLLNHPDVARIAAAARSQDEPLESVHPHLLGSGLEFTTPDEVTARAGDFDVVFLCTPSGEAMRRAGDLLAAGTRVVDLSADFRFADPGTYARAYGAEHTATDALAEAVYGVSEFNRERIARARLIANPGCYVITALLGVVPLYDSGIADPASPLNLVGINGTSGAGNKPRAEVMHPNAFAALLPYSLQGHRHAHELEDQIGRGVVVDLSTAHGNFARGIHIQATVPVRADVRGELSREALLDLYRARYKDEFFVRVNARPAHGGLTDKDYRRYPTLAGVTGSNFCHIGLDYDARRGAVKVVAVTDNLVKGAAGSAIQNMNLMLGLDETAGLRTYGF